MQKGSPKHSCNDPRFTKRGLVFVPIDTLLYCIFCIYIAYMLRLNFVHIIQSVKDLCLHVYLYIVCTFFVKSLGTHFISHFQEYVRDVTPEWSKYHNSCLLSNLIIACIAHLFVARTFLASSSVFGYTD